MPKHDLNDSIQAVLVKSKYQRWGWDKPMTSMEVDQLLEDMHTPADAMAATLCITHREFLKHLKAGEFPPYLALTMRVLKRSREESKKP
jgi:hypothetical protein